MVKIDNKKQLLMFCTQVENDTYKRASIPMEINKFESDKMKTVYDLLTR